VVGEIPSVVAGAAEAFSIGRADGRVGMSKWRMPKLPTSEKTGAETIPPK
jgi:hypothetical protein